MYTKTSHYTISLIFPKRQSKKSSVASKSTPPSYRYQKRIKTPIPKKTPISFKIYSKTANRSAPKAPTKRKCRYFYNGRTTMTSPGGDQCSDDEDPFSPCPVVRRIDVSNVHVTNNKRRLLDPKGYKIRFSPSIDGDRVLLPTVAF